MPAIPSSLNLLLPIIVILQGAPLRGEVSLCAPRFARQELETTGVLINPP
jgi:hypothetical protein